MSAAEIRAFNARDCTIKGGENHGIEDPCDVAMAVRRAEEEKRKRVEKGLTGGAHMAVRERERGRGRRGRLVRGPALAEREREAGAARLA